MKTVIRPETEMKDSGIDTVEKMPLSWNKIRLELEMKIQKMLLLMANIGFMYVLLLLKDVIDIHLKERLYL